MVRAVVLMLDSVGIGEAPDAAMFGDEGANTLKNIAKANLGLNIPNLTKLGIAKAAEWAEDVEPLLKNQDIAKISLPSCYGRAKEISQAKDTSSGHWEMAGVPVLEKWGYFERTYPSFPSELVKEICEEAEIEGILGNKAASGTEIIEELGEEHIKTGRPIFYTSADSCLQIAAHETYFGLRKLEKLAEIAFKKVAPYRIARVIIRPFEGEKKGEFVRTKNRHDYSVKPPKPTVLDKMVKAGGEVIAIGKVSDIFAGCGISKKVQASGNDELWNKTLQEVEKAPDNSIIFTNFVDFDMLYGHRRDIKGYAKALEDFDKKLPDIESYLKDDDVVFVTADHGNDPTWRGTDHTREQVPILMFGKRVKPRNLGQRNSFADIGQSLAEMFNLEPFEYGQSFWKDK